MYWREEDGCYIDALYVDDLDRVDGGDGEGRGLLVSVVQLVEVLVQPRPVVDAVRPVRDIVLLINNNRVQC